MLMPHIPKTPAAPAREPGLSGMATSTRLPGSWAPTRYTSASITSEAVTMPTSSSPSSTGRHPILLSRMVFAACSMGSSGCTLTTSVAITSCTSTSCRTAARAGSPSAGVEERRSLSETIPTRVPSFRTGRCLMRRSRHRARAVAAVSSGESVTISRDIESLT
jgi:hypothetical protein